MKDNWTVGGTFQFSPELFDYDPDKVRTPKQKADTLVATIGISGQYNSYTGYSFSPSFGMSYTMASGNSIGFNGESTPDGLVISPNLSFSNIFKNSKEEEVSLNLKAGLAFNSRQGLTSMNMSTSMSNPSVNEENKLIT